MSGSLAARPQLEHDFDTIEAAVMETDRGRWFLSEYAKRNRQADTQVLLTALSRIEKSISIQREPTELDKFRGDILEMSRAIARTRSEIAAIKPIDQAAGGRILEASGELGAIVGSTESATSDILASAEQVQELAWTMREAGGDAAICDRLDHHATSIYTACSFQDLTSQRIRKVIEALSFLEDRVNAMVDIWGFATEADENLSMPDPNAGITNDPSMSQADVDFVLVDDDDFRRFDPAVDDVDEPAPVQEPVVDELASSELEMPGVPETSVSQADLRFAGDLMAVDVTPAPEDLGQPLLIEGEVGFGSGDGDVGVVVDFPQAVKPTLVAQPILVSSEPPQDPAAVASLNSLMVKVRSGAELSADEASRALDVLQRMSIEDRTRLFN